MHYGVGLVIWMSNQTPYYDILIMTLPIISKQSTKPEQFDLKLLDERNIVFHELKEMKNFLNEVIPTILSSGEIRGNKPLSYTKVEITRKRTWRFKCSCSLPRNIQGFFVQRINKEHIENELKEIINEVAEAHDICLHHGPEVRITTMPPFFVYPSEEQEKHLITNDFFKQFALVAMYMEIRPPNAPQIGKRIRFKPYTITRSLFKIGYSLTDRLRTPGIMVSALGDIRPSFVMLLKGNDQISIAPTGIHAIGVTADRGRIILNLDHFLTVTHSSRIDDSDFVTRLIDFYSLPFYSPSKSADLKIWLLNLLITLLFNKPLKEDYKGALREDFISILKKMYLIRASYDIARQIFEQRRIWELMRKLQETEKSLVNKPAEGLTIEDKILLAAIFIVHILKIEREVRLVDLEKILRCLGALDIDDISLLLYLYDLIMLLIEAPRDISKLAPKSIYRINLFEGVDLNPAFDVTIERPSGKNVSIEEFEEKFFDIILHATKNVVSEVHAIKFIKMEFPRQSLFHRVASYLYRIGKKHTRVMLYVRYQRFLNGIPLPMIYQSTALSTEKHLQPMILGVCIDPRSKAFVKDLLDEVYISGGRVFASPEKPFNIGIRGFSKYSPDNLRSIASHIKDIIRSKINRIREYFWRNEKNVNIVLVTIPQVG